MRVVIVDDSRTEREYLRRVMRDGGHEVIGEASNGILAIDVCARTKPDVVLMDVAMRGMHGDVAARQIKKEGSARHIVIVSSNVGFLGDQYRDEGFVCMNKPHSDAKILDVLKELERGEPLAGPAGASGSSHGGGASGLSERPV